MNQPKSQEFVKNLSEFFQRDLISIPLIKKYPHQLFNQRCGLKASTLELDTSAFPNIEYIAGNRLSVYPVNPNDHVDTILKHVIDDISNSSNLATTKTTATSNNQNLLNINRIKLSDPWNKFVQLNGRGSVKLALSYLYDIMTAPSRDLIRLMAENCSNKEHKSKLIAISRTDESWEKWICQSLRTLKSTLDEFNSCFISAKSLFSELQLQQPRQYSISSIKSNKRFRTEIIVFQHKFTTKSIAYSLQQVKELEYSIREQQQDNNNNNDNNNNIVTSKATKSQMPLTAANGQQLIVSKAPIHIDHNDSGSQRSTSSIRSIRSMIPYGVSPISTQQVKRVPKFTGPFMSLYASSSQGKPVDKNILRQSQLSLRGKSLIELGGGKNIIGTTTAKTSATKSSTGSIQQSLEKQFDGLCSNYLLNLNANDFIICEFVENPRFTLKGNRERPIMMISQDIGIVAYRPFWQQRALEHDRAQIFYTLFKDLPPKKFGDMQLVCITGNRCKFEDLFRREINHNITNKIMSSASFINKKYLINLLDRTSLSSATGSDESATLAGFESNKLQIESKELIELGKRISKLLIENNGCLYTCCDPQITQAIEILTVESIARYHNMARDKIMALLPTWKGRQQQQQQLQNQNQNQTASTNKFLFTLENPFERAQIVQEIYDVVC